MIVASDSLSGLRNTVAMVDGGFDPLHAGHTRYFREARRLRLPVLCNVASDEYVSMKHRPLLPEGQRIQVLDALEDITYTHLNRWSTAHVLRELIPRYYVKGKDWEGRLPDEQVDVCRDLGITIVYLDTIADSSTRILSAATQLSDSYRIQVDRFEQLVLDQRPVPSSHYDDEYFVSAWREGSNRYTVEDRRSIEGRNPQLIADVFRPSRVLDLGCGPGILMYLLHELGVETAGVDFSPRIRELAPPEIRDRILIGTVTSPPVADNAADLVICREVLEHLTVLQIREAIRQMVRVTSRFVYLTTRYHPSPDNLLSVTTQFDVDPSHISLLSKDFVRTLFIMEGCRSRPDLEEAMDWQKKGRVIVMEKVPSEGRG